VLFYCVHKGLIELGEIDNKFLLDNEGDIKITYHERQDFIILNEEAWRLLHKWYLILLISYFLKDALRCAVQFVVMLSELTHFMFINSNTNLVNSTNRRASLKKNKIYLLI
jgi:hypothetical protein